MNDDGYGLWVLVVIDTAVVILFAASFFHPRSGRDWRALGTFSAFAVALFTEMYGAPLTISLLSSWLGNSVLGLDVTHAGGHLWNDLVGWKAGPHISPFHLVQWPTIPTLLMFPVLVSVYRRLATSEERETRERFGATWDAYAAITPRFLPRRDGTPGPARLGRPEVSS